MELQTLYPVIYPDPVKQQAYTLHVYRGYDPLKIAKITGQPRDIILEWATQDEWDTRRQEHLTQARAAAAASVGMQVSARTRGLTRKFLDVQEAMINRLQDKVNEGAGELTVDQLGKLSSALSSLYGTFSGLLGVGGVATTKTDAASGAASEKTPTTLVQVNVLADLVRAGERKAGFGDTTPSPAIEVQVKETTLNAS
jgi:hypothetical protein